MRRINQEPPKFKFTIQVAAGRQLAYREQQIQEAIAKINKMNEPFVEEEYSEDEGQEEEQGQEEGHIDRRL